MMNQIIANKSNLQEEQLKQSIIKLAYFNPTAQDEYCNQILDYLVLDSLVTNGHLLQINATQVKKNIKHCFHIDFEEAEIKESAKRLTSKGFIRYIGGNAEEERRGEKPQFQILEDTEDKINNNILKIQKIEGIVINEWREYLLDKYSDYPKVEDNIDLIADNLKLFITKLLIRHGAECVAILYPEEKKTQEWLSSIKNNILDDLPKINSFIDPIISFEIPNFFINNESNRKFYISSLFNSSFFWHLIQVDEGCSKLLHKVTDGQMLFLDNNILFSLVGLHGDYLLKSVHRILDFANRLGYRLMVTEKTIEEFQESLRHNIDDIKPIPQHLAKMAIENLETDNFISCYWKEFVNNGIGIQEFVTEKSHLENIMEGLNIKITNEFRNEIEMSNELKEEESILHSMVPSTDRHIINHDAFHRVLINKIRDGEKYNFSNSKAWFLTHDKKLPMYSKVAKRGRVSLPFCLLTSQWVQLNRPLLTRTKDEKEYEESFYTLVTQPYLRAMMSSLSMDKTYNEVIYKLARYEKMNPQVALKIVTDTHLMITLATESDKEKKEEQLENKFLDVASQLQAEKEELDSIVSDKNEDIQILKQKVDDIESKIRDNDKKLKDQAEEFSRKINVEIESKKEAEKNSKLIEKKFKNYKLTVSAKQRLYVTISIFIILELAVCYLSNKYGNGLNIWQKLLSSFPFLGLPIIISCFLGWFIIGKKRLIILGWPWNKIFKCEDNNFKK
jgi:hypothetical protein